jgi:peptide/nickel transport system permease protein
MATGDFGRQVANGRPVSEQIARRLPATMELGIAAMLIAIAVGVPLGMAAAVKKRTWIDGAASAVALSGLSLPVFWLGLMLMLAFGGLFGNGGRYDVMIDWGTPESGYWTGFLFIDAIAAGKWDLFVSGLQRMVLPACALATIPLAMIVRVTRTAMLDVLSSDYVRTARAKGLSERVVIVKHALRNAMIPVVTITATQAGYLMGGAALTEKVFAWPGLGSFTVEAVIGRDYPSVQAAVLLAAVVFVCANLLSDVLYAVVNPKVRAGIVDQTA